MADEIHIVGIGSSSGGLEALRALFSNISFNPNTAYIVVSHLPNDNNTQLDYLISQVTPLTVQLLVNDTVVCPNHVYVLPGNKRVSLKEGVLTIRARRKSEVINRAIDEFFISLAEDQGKKSVAVVLSGMGDDGSVGVKAVHDNGGIVMVQDPDSTAFKSMPRAAISADHPAAISFPETLGAILSDTQVN